MKSYTGALFNSGPVERLLDLAARCQESSGASPLDDDLRRFIRIVENSNAAHWACPISTVAALLEFLGDVVDGDSAPFVPAEFQQRLLQVADGAGGGEYLRTLAGIIRILSQGPVADYAELPMAAWEARVLFPRLGGFGANWIYDGEYASIEDSVRAAVDSEHPYCPEFLSPLAAEAQTALVLFPEQESFRVNISEQVPWASIASVRELLALINDHMRHEH
ncbi:MULTISPECIES: hypothetical protein [unclassified Streptomyces]|uniref:hypothetical protein n=1 Tax=unclassified Streptomyces TaxID=2593676 RepID=UPI002DD9A377|nr:hypothetical protein [Streptomyces sp. NBC_01445]WSE06986.1 hypothetical protein OG574_28825 [Streptomyces sp. NBC_01445]